MPDENVSQPSLEQLLAEAQKTHEAQTSPIKTDEKRDESLQTDYPESCQHTRYPPTDRKNCLTCHNITCPDCWSILDPVYCRNCLREVDAELKELPLKDVDGVQHAGRELIPAETAIFFQPHYGTLAKTIADMSTVELESHIDRYKELVRQAERALDFRRIVLGSSQLEMAQRQDADRRRLRSDKTKYPVKTVSFDKDGKKVTKTASAGKLADMLKMIEALQKLKQVKKP